MKWQKHKLSLFLAASYLLIFLVSVVVAYNSVASETAPDWIRENTLALRCGFCGGLGGLIYLFRAIYLRSCVHDDWDGGWMPWYIIRPIVSVLCGLVAFIFLSAGLIILDGSRPEDASEFGFYALAILAGLNVDRFVGRVEEVGKSVFGIEKSRTSERSEKEEDESKKSSRPKKTRSPN